MLSHVSSRCFGLLAHSLRTVGQTKSYYQEPLNLSTSDKTFRVSTVPLRLQISKLRRRPSLRSCLLSTRSPSRSEPEIPIICSPSTGMRKRDGRPPRSSPCSPLKCTASTRLSTTLCSATRVSRLTKIPRDRSDSSGHSVTCTGSRSPPRHSAFRILMAQNC